jgi:hypothetical protein
MASGREVAGERRGNRYKIAHTRENAWEDALVLKMPLLFEL